MKRFLAAVVVLSLTASQAFAAGHLNVGIDQSFGTDSYEATNVYVAAGLGGFSIAPEVKRYSYDNVPHPVASASARLGYDTKLFGIGATAGFTPKSNDYSNTYAGADVAFTISAKGEEGIRRIGGPGRGGAPVGKGIARVDFGGGFLTTNHRYQRPGSTIRDKLTQTEVDLFIGASIMDFLLLSARGARFTYNESPAARANLPPAYWTPVAGMVSYVNGFPHSSFHMRGEVPTFPMVRPFADYTFTKFKDLANNVHPGDQKAVGFGVRVGLELIAVEARYQHVNVTGAAKDNNFASVGAVLRM